MESFRYKEGYPTGAGECVSLSALYAAAAFVIADIPLDDIFLLATPLHSQNFLNAGEGILTNNRRIVTKAMWFNGTELSAKARRALENEKITVVTHRTGYIHTLYNTATISKSYYELFVNKLRAYLKTTISFEIIANFLRQNNKLQCCFQIAHKCCGKPRYIEAEKVYQYEHSSKARVGDSTQNVILHEIEEDEFYTSPIPGRMILGEIEQFFKENRVVLDEKKTIEKLKMWLCSNCFNVDMVVHDLIKFCNTDPKLPFENKEWIESVPIDLENVKSPSEALEKLENIRDKNPTVDLAFTAFRDLSRSHWKPFLKAALERNPVSILGMSKFDVGQIYNVLQSFENKSIYDESTRMAQPDEVWNYKRGDGLEKAITLINILKSRYTEEDIHLEGDKDKIIVKMKNFSYLFESTKELSIPEEKDFYL